MPDPDGSVAALEAIAGSQVWQAGGTEVRAGSQDAINKAGSMRARPVSRRARFVFFLLDQAGRTGLVGRHSTTWVAVVSAARLPAHELAPYVAEHTAGPFDEAVVAGSEIRDKTGGSGRLVPAHLLVVIIRVFNPARARTSAGRVRVRAVHTRSRTWIYVQLAVDHDRVAGVDGHAWSQGGVVVHLQTLAPGRLALYAFSASPSHPARP